MPHCIKVIFITVCLLFLGACRERALNDPYPTHPPGANVLYTAFSEQPKHLDPARSYSSNEWAITNQVYETPLQYHYLKRPYQLEPLLLKQMPSITYLNAKGEPVSENDADITYSRYTLTIRPGVYYQPHPAFARKEDGRYFYHALTEEEGESYTTLSDFPLTGTRELTAVDMVYQIKRLASPKTQSPIFGFLSDYIVGLSQLRKDLEALPSVKEGWLDLRDYHLAGIRVVDDYTYTITIKGRYPQFLYWLSLPFFCPMPWEADKFYAQPGLIEHNISLDWYPVGTGAYQLIENNPNRQMILIRNPHYHEAFYPSEGEVGDKDANLLARAGQRLPFIDRVQFSLEKESIPYWNKFLQGYYDRSGVGNDSFDQALQFGSQGELALTDEMKEHGIRLVTEVNPSVFYWGFNMRDPVVGGLSDTARYLRQAISIAFDIEEYIQIFLNGRGMVAQGPIPPGIFGYNEFDYNPIIYKKQGDSWQRRSLEEAKALLAKAGYPDGIDPATKKPLVLYFDTVSDGGPDRQAQFAWLRKQFQKLGITLIIRDTQYNRFQEKMRVGNAQIFNWGWNADYPDPENFLFLLYGPNSKIDTSGENAANYHNAAFDQLFNEMKHLPDSQQRADYIQQMITILREDSPWIFGVYPKTYLLEHAWVAPTKTNALSRNTLKYESVDAILRDQKRFEWNQAIYWPIWVGIVGFLLFIMPAYLLYRRRVHHVMTRGRLEEQA